VTPSPARRHLAGLLMIAGLLALVGLDSVGAGVLLLALAVAATLLFGERGALYLMIASAPLEVYRAFFPPVGVNISPYRILLVYCLVQAVAYALIRRRRPTFDWLLVGFTVFVGLEILTLYRALDFDQSARIVGGHASGLAGALLVSWRLRSEPPRSLVVALLGGSVVPIVIGLSAFLLQSPGHYPLPPGVGGLDVPASIAQQLQGATYSESSIGRNKGTFADPNHFAAFLVVLTMLGLGIQAVLRRWHVRLLCAIWAGVALVALLTTFSRSGLLTAVVGIALLYGRALWAHAVAASRLRVALLVAGFVVLLGVSWVASPEDLHDRMNPLTAANSASFRSHEQTRTDAIELFAEYPLLGVGPGNFGPLTGQPTSVSGTHSIYTTALAEMGLIGILAFLVTPLAVVYRRRRMRELPYARLVTGAYLVLLINNVLYDAWANEFQWMLIGAVSVATIRWERSSDSVDDQLRTDDSHQLSRLRRAFAGASARPLASRSGCYSAEPPSLQHAR
jgi:hypothetical protein